FRRAVAPLPLRTAAGRAAAVINFNPKAIPANLTIMAHTTLEDSVADVIGKSQRGQGIDDDALVKRAEITPDDLEAAREGRANHAVYDRIGKALGLSGTALVGHATYLPQPLDVEGLAQFVTPYDDMTVNSYIVADLA